MDAIGTAFGVLIVAGFIVIACGLVLAYPIMLLWNGCLVPAVSNVHDITWMQAWGLMVLVGILFKSSTTSTSKD